MCNEYMWVYMYTYEYMWVFHKKKNLKNKKLSIYLSYLPTLQIS